MSSGFSMGSRKIGAGQSVYIIAEAGVNHNGNLKIAKDLVLSAKRTGADCVKFQTFKAESLVTHSAPKANYQLKTTPPKESQFDMLKKLELPMDSYRELIALCKEQRIQFLSTPYSVEDIDFLMKLGVEGFKVASGQLAEPYFLKYLAKQGKPIIVSTGMATMEEVARGVAALKSIPGSQFALLQCTTDYPSRIEEANLRAMQTMRQAFDVEVGYSDHVPTHHCVYASIALGATIIEKHFTLDQKMEGPDQACSLDEAGFTEMIQGIRMIEASLGTGIKEPSASETVNAQGMRRSIVAKRALRKGEKLSLETLAFKRPASGLSPAEFERLEGKTVNRDIAADEMIGLGMIEW